MGTYLAMVNNLKRQFANKMTYVLMLLIPVLIIGVGMLSSKFEEKTIRVGILYPQQEMQRMLEELEHVQYEIVEEDIWADYIMGKYHYVINPQKEEEAQKIIREIASQTGAIRETNQLSTSERQIAMLITAYLVIATVYATKYIQDRGQRLVERFQLAGMKRRYYLAGYVLSTAVLIFIQISIAMLCLYLFDKELEVGITQVFVMAIAMSGITTVYGVSYAFICKREMTANIMASSCAMILSILGGTFVGVEQMPRVLQLLSVISPVTWILGMM